MASDLGVFIETLVRDLEVWRLVEWTVALQLLEGRAHAAREHAEQCPPDLAAPTLWHRHCLVDAAHTLSACEPDWTRRLWARRRRLPAPRPKALGPRLGPALEAAHCLYQREVTLFLGTCHDSESWQVLASHRGDAWTALPSLDRLGNLKLDGAEWEDVGTLLRRAIRIGFSYTYGLADLPGFLYEMFPDCPPPMISKPHHTALYEQILRDRSAFPMTVALTRGRLP